MRVAEIFHSIQGEGMLTGVPSVFVRTSGCPLRCEWCDSPYTSWAPEGETVPVPEILRRVAGYSCRHVVVTGGEPMSAPEISTLCAGLRSAGQHITIETAAIEFSPVECDLASLSPKLSSSTPHTREGGKYALRHEERRLRPDIIAAFMARGEYQLKFVVDRPGDLDEIAALLAMLPPVPPERVLLMPQGVTGDELAARSAWLVGECLRRGWRFCPRLHIALFGNKRGT
jgi:7-carboxy-7-deazaguanine synthase